MAYRAARVFTVSYCGSSCSASTASNFGQIAALHANNNSNNSQQRRDSLSHSASMLAPSLHSFSVTQQQQRAQASFVANANAALRSAASSTIDSNSTISADVSAAYRERIQRLVGEAARADWQDVTKLYEPTSNSNTMKVAPSNSATVNGISFEDAQRLHRLYYNHIMSDALAQYDSELFQVRQQIVASEGPLHLLPPERMKSIQRGLYDSVKARLAARMLWFSPVARCIETDGIEQLVEGLSNPFKFMEELQQAKVRNLRQLTSQKLFL